MVNNVPPIRELLNRIRWDEEFGRGVFEVGYCDHVQGGIVRIPFEEVKWGQGNRFSFEVETAEGEIRSIPFHRVREVFRDGVLIWKREKGMGAS